MQAIPSLTNREFQESLASNSVIAELKTAIATHLAPKVQDIDLNGEYPREFMHQVGKIGGFGQAVSPEFGGSGRGLQSAVQVIEAISQECLCTGFITWCQIACTWYLQNTDNAFLKREILPLVATGKAISGTGLSNPMKHFADIEKIALFAERRSNGYVINGMLPWVSNIGVGQLFGIVAKLVDSEALLQADRDDYLMAIVSDSFDGLILRQTAHFIALEGSGTYRCVFQDVFVPDEFILASPCQQYVKQIRPGFILTQVGMGLGLTEGCISTIRPRQCVSRRSSRRHSS